MKPGSGGSSAGLSHNPATFNSELEFFCSVEKCLGELE
jgi:hypothetical protein